MQGNPHNVEGTPPERDEDTTPSEPGGENPERQGPGGPPGPSDAPAPEKEQGQSGPPPESIPGDEGQVPNPRGA